MDTSLPMLLLIAAAGVGSGLLNVLAGGGSLIVMPVLLEAGLPGPMTNGSTRVGILAQNAAAQARFLRGGQRPDRETLMLAALALPGAVLGAWFGVKLEGAAFKWVLAGVMVAAWASMALSWWRERRAATADVDDQAPAAPPPKWVVALAMTAIGLYGGFIQAGVGLLIMAVLERVLRVDLVRVNVLKVWIVAIYTVPVLGVFAARGAVNLTVGLTLAVGTTLGGWLGARLTLKRGSGFIRVVYSLVLLALLVKMLLP